MKNRHTIFEGNNGVNYLSTIKSSYLGKGTYIGNRCRLSNVKIGRFCSIGDEVSVICGTHPVNEFISTHPAFYSKDNFSGLTYSTENKFQEFKHSSGNYLVSIGNDVWIGSRVSILQGVNIGTGAIIAAGAVVVKDVQPYEVVGGVPAKRIRMRFEEEQVKLLLKAEWWQWEDKVLKEKARLFANPEAFLESIRNESYEEYK